MTHKYAFELKQGDIFNLAANLFKVLDTTEVDDEDMISVTCVMVVLDQTLNRRTRIVLPKYVLFHLS